MSFNQTYAETLEKARSRPQRPRKPISRGTKGLNSRKSHEVAPRRSGNGNTSIPLKHRGIARGKAIGAKKRGIRKRGPRTDRWLKVWAWLKPRLETAGRTTCEFDFINHECWEDFAIDPVHPKKRRLWKGLDIYTVAIGCRIVHGILDEEMSHAEMEKAVLTAIELNGGLIVP